MARSYNFKTPSGSTVLPTADGEYFTDDLNPSDDDGELYLEFFNSESDASNNINAVTPSAGTITASGSPLGNIFLRDVNSVTVNAADVSSPDASYTPPFFTGRVVKAKIDFSGISGASHCLAVLVRRAS